MILRVPRRLDCVRERSSLGWPHRALSIIDVSPGRHAVVDGRNLRTRSRRCSRTTRSIRRGPSGALPSSSLMQTRRSAQSAQFPRRRCRRALRRSPATSRTRRRPCSCSRSCSAAGRQRQRVGRRRGAAASRHRRRVGRRESRMNTNIQASPTVTSGRVRRSRRRQRWPSSPIKQASNPSPPATGAASISSAK